MDRCRVCLTGNIRLLNISERQIEVYEKLTDTKLQLDVQTNDKVPSVVCYVCHHLLQRCYTFAEMARKSNKILQYLLNRGIKMAHLPVSVQSLETTKTLTMSPIETVSITNEPHIPSSPTNHLIQYETEMLQADVEKDIEEFDTLETVDKSITYHSAEELPEEFTSLYCHICKRAFKKESYLTRHNIKFHNETERYHCVKCSEVFNSLSALKSHMKSHAPLQDSQRPYTCDTCHKNFKNKHTLFKHERTHSGYICDTCNKSYRCKNDLIPHLQHEAGIKSYSCNKCDRTFYYKGSLMKHMKNPNAHVDKSQARLLKFFQEIDH